MSGECDTCSEHCVDCECVKETNGCAVPAVPTHYILTICGVFIRWDEIYKLDHEWDKSEKIISTYFYLKNGEKHHAYENEGYFFMGEESELYEFCIDCHIQMKKILMENILNHFFKEGGYIFDVAKHYESIMWEQFIEWAKQNRDDLYADLEK